MACTTRPPSWCAVVASRQVGVAASTSAIRSRTTRPATSSGSARSASSSSTTARSPSRRTSTCRSSSTRRRARAGARALPRAARHLRRGPGLRRPRHRGHGARAARGEATRPPSSLRSGGASMSGAHSRRKGAGFERELVQRFREVMPDATIRRGLQFRTGEETPDVDCPVFWPEAKRAASSRTSGARCARPRTPPRPDASPSPSSATTAPSRSLR